MKRLALPALFIAFVVAPFLAQQIPTLKVDVDLVLISTEGQKAIDVFHITRGGAKLSEDAQAALKADLDRMLKESA